MTVIKVSILMQKQILELHSKGFTARRIAKSLKVGRNTIRRILERGDVATPGAVVPDWAKLVDWEKVRLEASRGVQMNILAREHAEGKISYVQFWREYNKKYPSHPTVTMKLIHKPGDRCFFDYTEGIDIVDRESGEIRKTSLLCGVMAMSSMTYGQFTMTQKRDDLMRSMESAFRFLGGVTPYVTVDNQKAAVDVAHWYDPDMNPAFIDFANHWGFAVIPARPYRPQDKGGNECGIGVIQRQFYQEVRGRIFYSLSELNSAFAEYLTRLNLAVMKDWGVSRMDRFEGERHLLKALPLSNWEPSEWKTPKVHADCHVQALKKFYSVPYQHVGQEVRVRLTAKLVEVFDKELNPLCVHARLLGRETHSTNESHYPAEKVAMTQFSVQVAKRESAKIGPETERLVNQLLDIAYPLKYLRRVQGILRLYQGNHVSREGLEHGCKMGLAFNKTFYGYVFAAAKFFDQNGNRPTLVKSAPIREASTLHLHNNQQQMEESGNDE
ncbi:MAG: IS21 family transposase [Bdellovibrionaceae bacterium]|nr:IS21 family transposase [Pseudobdellovibrionaceae bacterium]